MSQEIISLEGFHNVFINIAAQRKAIFRDVKTQCFAHKGLIFGGMPRDEIIQEYYSDLFMDYAIENDFNATPEFLAKFWDTTVHPESAARTLVPNDADIFFRTTASATEFIQKMKEMFPGEEFYIPEAPDNFANALYSGSQLSLNIIVKKCRIRYYAGKTRTFEGYLVEVPVDIVYPRNISIMHEEPPFGSCDMMCNIFIEDSFKSRRISKDAGAWFNKLSTYKKTVITTKIIKNMIEFKTDIIKDPSKVYDNLHDIERYVKMMSRPKFPWTITNLPYNLVKTITLKEKETEPVCCICQDMLNSPDNTEYSISVINALNSVGEKVDGSKLHHSCLLKSFVFQISEAGAHRRRQDTSEYCVKCPYKSRIDFSECLSKINWKDNYLTL